jgi:hypothetical protein
MKRLASLVVLPFAVLAVGSTAASAATPQITVAYEANDSNPFVVFKGTGFAPNESIALSVAVHEWVIARCPENPRARNLTDLGLVNVQGSANANAEGVAQTKVLLPLYAGPTAGCPSTTIVVNEYFDAITVDDLTDGITIAASENEAFPFHVRLSP